MYLAPTSSRSLAKESVGEVDREASQCSRKAFPGRRMGAKETVRYWLVGCKPVPSLSQGGRHRKEQALLLPRMARNPTGDSRGLLKVGAKKQEPQRRSGSGKEVSLSISSMKANRTGPLQYGRVGV